MPRVKWTWKRNNKNVQVDCDSLTSNINDNYKNEASYFSISVSLNRSEWIYLRNTFVWKIHFSINNMKSVFIPFSWTENGSNLLL